MSTFFRYKTGATPNIRQWRLSSSLTFVFAYRLNQLQLLHGILNSVILHILCKERGIRFQFHIMVSHQNTVLRMFKHRKIIGAVTEHISILQRYPVFLKNHIDSSRLGIIRRNTFVESVSAVNDVVFQSQSP